MEAVEVPSYFLCPISLQIMRDPVTLATGITYDRESIEQWIFSGGHATCPVTKQPLPDSSELTPNHTLRRLIQAWCAANASNGIERFPTPRPPVDRAQITALLEDAKLPHALLPCLRKMKKLVAESERNKRSIEAAPGVLDFLASVLSGSFEPPDDRGEGASSAGDEALNILCSLQVSDRGLRRLLERHEGILDSLTSVLRRSNFDQSRAYAVLMIRSLLGVSPSSLLMNLKKEFFEVIVKVLRDRISYQAMKAALQVLYGVCSCRRNRAKAVGAGTVAVLIDLLLDEQEKRACEMMLVVLEELCGCAEGRTEIIGHAAGLAVVSKKIIRVSPEASKRAVRVLYMVALYAASPTVLEEMAQVGAVAKLCLVMRMESGKKVREMAREILRMHSRVWRSSPCLSPELRGMYPS
ncbi:E3 ubiquitin-protein ligase PUB23 [Apostasia shenzhenica]|uniref:U-box domain-containing protein n=1 Tax=Apostasia shenzhenica TaxID=1088818 RepID=A0A2I0AEG1_9ASPA|nr:E3 ubiquitin-protein ligase PUB23 [Apostasia shenzhenica]